MTRLNWPTECEDGFQATFNSPEDERFGGLEFHRLSSHSYIVEITCYRGAYQPGSVVAWYDSKTQESKLLKFKGMESEDEQEKELPYSEMYGFTTWHPKSRRLEIFAKYRGPGDCGFWGLYGFKGSRPVLLDAREKDCGDGPYTRRSIDYRRWPRKRF